MSFEAYMDNIAKKTGKTSMQMRDEAIEQGILTDDMKAIVFTDWLKNEYQLGHGHAMAMWKYFIDHQWIITKHSKL
jgi:predicted DNA-binding protein